MSTTTKYGVARDQKIIGDVYTDIDVAKRQLAFVEDSMRAAGLEPDVHLVTVEEKVTLGRPRVYREAAAPDPELVEVPTPEGGE